MEITRKLHYFLHFQYTNSIYLNSPFHFTNIYSFLVVQSLMYLKKFDNRVKYKKKKKKRTFLVITRAIMAYSINGQMGHKKLILKPPNPILVLLVLGLYPTP